MTPHMIRIPRGLLGVLCGAALVSATASFAQTRESPLTGGTQILAGWGSRQEFVIDPGVSQVWLEVRQQASYDAYTVTAPGGQPLASTVALTTVMPRSDMTSVDPLGLFAEVVTWSSPPVGTYAIDSRSAYTAMVFLEGGAQLSFWVDELGADRLLRPGQTFTLATSLRDAAGQPISGAAVTAVVEQTLDEAGRRPWSAWKMTLVLDPTVTPGTYRATMPGGLPAGVYTFSVDARKDLVQVRRELVTSLAVTAPGGAPMLPPSGPLQAVPVQDATDVGLAPQDLDVSASSTAGRIFYFPEDRADVNKPVVVFVHGFAAGPGDFTGASGFVGAALEANYRAAAVELHPDESFMTNAALLAQAFPQIAAYYDVKKLVVVAHSKGGVDTDAALLFGGMTEYVKSVITLSSPHWGTPLADLADSQWLSWLADIFGRRNNAQASMKPGVMAQFRAQAAVHPRNTFQFLDIRTVGAWRYWDEPLTYYQLSGLYLRQHGGGLSSGGNDGVVNYKDSRRPVSTEIFSGYPDSRTGVNHRELVQRAHYWKHVQAQLLTVSFDNSPAAPAGLAAVLYGASSPPLVRLAWTDRSRYETGFLLERAVDGGPFMARYTIPAGYQEVFEGDVQAGHTYAYRLRASIGDRWFSDYSNTATVTFPAQVPTAPSSLTVWLDAYRVIRLAWTDNSLDETGFTVEYWYSGSGWITFCNVGPNVTGCASGANPPAGSYYFRVRAFNGAGSSDYSNTTYLYVPAPVTPTTSIAWIQPAESSWGPAGTLTAAGYAQNGTGTVQLVWRERGNDGGWGPWTATAYQAPVGSDGTWSNTISSGYPTNRCHWFEAYTNYSGVSSAVFSYTGAPGCPTPSASIAWIQPAELSWGPSGTMTVAGYASGGTGGVQLVWRELVNGWWGSWNVVAWQPVPSADTTWSNTIPSPDRCNWFEAYVNYSGATSPVYTYTGQNCR
jgi:hypothetical protein